MSFLRVTFWGSLYSLLRLACSLAVTKLLAIYTGPGGLAIFGQFQSLVSLATNFSTAGVTNGVIKHVAEYADRPHEQVRLMQTATYTVLGFSALVGFTLVLGSAFLSTEILRGAEHRSALVLLGALLVFFSLNLCLGAQLNGYQRSLSYFAIQACFSISLLVLVLILVPRFGLQGALVSVSVAQVLVFMVTVLVSVRIAAISPITWLPVLHADMARRLAGFSATAIVTAIALPGTQLVVRDAIISDVSLASAGFWQASLRLADAIMLTVTSVLTPYYLPRLAASAGAEGIAKHVRHFFKMVIPGFILVLLVVYAARAPILQLLFTSEFLPAERLLGVQFAGEFIKMAGWIFSTVLISRGRTSSVLVSELGFAVTFLVLADLFIPQFKEMGGNLAYLGAATFSTALLAAAYRHLLSAAVKRS